MTTSNAVTIKAGTYVANSDFKSNDVADLSIFGNNFSLTFISNSNTFDGINIQTSAMGIPYLYYGSTLTFTTSWRNEVYKTVVLETDQNTSNDFATWFNSSFTLQSDISAITDLKGTTWEVASGWQATAGYGKFSIECGITLSDWSGTVYGVLAIGYAPNNKGTEYVSTANSIAWGETVFPHNGVTNTSTVTLEDISGADTTNPSLIQWLETYGTLQEEPSTIDSVTITYGGHTITLAAGQKCTFKGGKVMQADIVAVVGASEAALILFYIDGISTPYQAESGMSWAEWCDSEYNTDGYYIDGKFVRPIVGIVVTNANANIVSPSSTIINGYAYRRMAAGGAD